MFLEGVQQALLKIMEGTVASVLHKVEETSSTRIFQVDTTNIFLLYKFISIKYQRDKGSSIGLVPKLKQLQMLLMKGLEPEDF